MDANWPLAVVDREWGKTRDVLRNLQFQIDKVIEIAVAQIRWVTNVAEKKCAGKNMEKIFIIGTKREKLRSTCGFSTLHWRFQLH